MNSKILIVLLIGIVFVSGCIEGIDLFKGLMGGEQEVKEQTPDIIVTQNLNIIPNPPLTAENEFSVIFDMKNQDKVNSIKDVSVKLYDWGACGIMRSDRDPDFSPDPEKWSYSRGVYSREFYELVPQQEERIEFRLKAPTNEEIGFIETDCPVKWLIDYKYSSITQDDFTIISRSRLNELQRAGESWTGTDNPMYIGAGPVKIYFDWKTPMPVQSKSSVQFSVRIQDKGVGDYIEVKEETLFIKVPNTWDDTNLGCPADKFEKLPDEGEFMIYKNKHDKPIPLIKKSSAELICRFKAPDLDISESPIPEKSYTVSANITDYNYKLTEDTIVHINPSV